MKFCRTRKNIILLSILILSIITIAVSFAYFFVVSSVGAETSLFSGSEKIEGLSFSNGEKVNVYATLENFSMTEGTLKDSANSVATLKSSESVGSASQTYNVYYYVSSNNFIYTQGNDTPELLLKIIDPSNTEITFLEGLEYKTIIDVDGNTLKGFDITTYNDVINIKENYSITNNDSNNPTVQNWNFEVIFVNLDADQSNNMGKNFESEVYLSKEHFTYPIYGKILADNGGEQSIKNKTFDVTKIPVTQSEYDSNPSSRYEIANGMYAADDDYGTTYFYRGAVENNWLTFAGFYWKILRIDGNGAIKLLYSGITPPTESEKIYKTGNDTSIAETTHGNQSNVLEEWYVQYIFEENFDSYINDALYCYDNHKIRDWHSGVAPGGGNYYSTEKDYAFTSRYPQTPSMVCVNKESSNTYNDIEKGNSSLIYPIGSITGDEALYVGALDDNIANHIASNNEYWTYTDYNQRFRRYEDSNGLSQTSSIWNSVSIQKSISVSSDNYDFLDIRPVIALKPTVRITGSGTWNDPYAVN